MKLYNVSKHVSSRQKSQVILDGISLNIPEGQLTAIIGPNGAGKSTLLNIMGHLDSSNQGDILLDEIPLDQWDRNHLAKRLSILKQKQHYDVKMTVYEFISFGRYPYSKGRLTAEDHAIIQDIIQYLELEDLQDRYINTLSGGQCQRCAIAMVMAQDTEFILLDEPLNNLDIRQEIHLMTLLKNLVEKLKKRVVIIMHDINRVSQFADYIIALKDGHLFHQGPREEVIQCPILEALYDIGVDVVQTKQCSLINFYEKEKLYEK